MASASAPVPAENSVRVATTGSAWTRFASRRVQPPRLEAAGRKAADLPVHAHSRPLPDERRAGGLGCLLDRALLTIGAASDGTFALLLLSNQNTLTVPFRSTGRVLFERRESG